MFRDAKVGDRVWSSIKGWGIIIRIDDLVTYPIIVKYDSDNVTDSFMNSGKWRTDHSGPILFWDEVKIIPPPKPKRKVKKVMIGELEICRCGSVMAVIGGYAVLSVFPGTGDAHCFHEEDTRERFPFRHEYEVEE